MKEFAMINYPFLFGDHFSNVSNEARLLYIEMMFFANNGFVANPRAILDARGYPVDVLNELIANGDVLKLPDRSEVFITSYFIHNPGFKAASWKNTPYAIYWQGKLHVKKNGVATFKPVEEEHEDMVIAAEEDDDPVQVERPMPPEEKTIINTNSDSVADSSNQDKQIEKVDWCSKNPDEPF